MQDQRKKIPGIYIIKRKSNIEQSQNTEFKKSQNQKQTHSFRIRSKPFIDNSTEQQKYPIQSYGGSMDVQAQSTNQEQIEQESKSPNIQVQDKYVPQYTIKPLYEEIEQKTTKKQTILLEEKCQVCAEEIYKGVLLRINKCNHVLHKQCLLQHLKYCINSNTRFKCPFFGCNNIIKQSFIRNFITKYLNQQASMKKPTQLEILTKKLLLLLQQYRKYQGIKNLNDLVKQKVVFHCPQPKCGELISGGSTSQTYAICKTTKNRICRKCGKKWHGMLDCNQLQQFMDPNSDDYKMIALAKQMQWMMCNRCMNLVEKNQGCVHITCKCGYEFCYKCGGPFPHCDCRNQSKRLWYQQFNQRN